MKKKSLFFYMDHLLSHISAGYVKRHWFIYYYLSLSENIKSQNTAYTLKKQLDFVHWQRMLSITAPFNNMDSEAMSPMDKCFFFHYHLLVRNRKCFPCFHKVMENSKLLWKHLPTACFHSFSCSPKLSLVLP